MRIFLDEMDELLKQREELQKQLDAKLEAAEEEDYDEEDEEENEKESSDEEDEEEKELERDKKVAKEPEVTRKVRDKTPPIGTGCCCVRPCLQIMFFSPFLSAAPLIFLTFCNVMCKQHQRNVVNPF